jgi:hypothetical protein
MGSDNDAGAAEASPLDASETGGNSSDTRNLEVGGRFAASVRSEETAEALASGLALASETAAGVTSAVALETLEIESCGIAGIFRSSTAIVRIILTDTATSLPKLKPTNLALPIRSNLINNTDSSHLPILSNIFPRSPQPTGGLSLSSRISRQRLGSLRAA